MSLAIQPTQTLATTAAPGVEPKAAGLRGGTPPKVDPGPQLVIADGPPVGADVALRMQQQSADPTQTPVPVTPGEVPNVGQKLDHVITAAKQLLDAGPLADPIDSLPGDPLIRVTVRNLLAVDGPKVEAYASPYLRETYPAQQDFYLAVTSSGFVAPGTDTATKFYGPFTALLY